MSMAKRREANTELNNDRYLYGLVNLVERAQLEKINLQKKNKKKLKQQLKKQQSEFNDTGSVSSQNEVEKSVQDSSSNSEKKNKRDYSPFSVKNNGNIISMKGGPNWKQSKFFYDYEVQTTTTEVVANGRANTSPMPTKKKSKQPQTPPTPYKAQHAQNKSQRQPTEEEVIFQDYVKNSNMNTTKSQPKPNPKPKSKPRPQPRWNAPPQGTDPMDAFDAIDQKVLGDYKEKHGIEYVLGDAIKSDDDEDSDVKNAHAPHTWPKKGKMTSRQAKLSYPF